MYVLKDVNTNLFFCGGWKGWSNNREEARTYDIDIANEQIMVWDSLGKEVIKEAE